MRAAHLVVFTLLFEAQLVPPAANGALLNAVRQLVFVLLAPHPSSTPPPASSTPRAAVATGERRLAKREVEAHPCDDEPMMTFLAEIQVTNPESIINLATHDDLPITCKQVSDPLANVEKYLATCVTPSKYNLYMQLTKGVARFVDLLCEQDTPTKTGFLMHAKCLKQLNTDYQNCYGPADWTENNRKRDICCAYKQVADCYFLKSSAICGTKAARAMKKIVTGVINAVIPVHCSLILDPCIDLSKLTKRSASALGYHPLPVMISLLIALNILVYLQI